MGKVIHRDDIKPVHAHTPPYDRDIQVYASPFCDRASVNFAMGVTFLAPGRVHEVHTHENEEVIYVLKGSGHGEIGGKKVEFRSGSIMQMNANESHGFVNDGGETVELLWVASPPGREKNFLPQK